MSRMATRITCAVTATLAVFAGCGKHSGGPSSGPVTVQVWSGDTGAPGVDLVFHAADGHVLEHVVTDANGRAVRDLPRNGMVSAFFDYGGYKDLETTMGGQPGDHLYFVK